MDISAKELSRQAIERVRVCEIVRFDFKMSQTPSVPQEGGFLIALLLTKNQCRIGVLTVCHFTYGLPQTQTPLCKGSSQHSWLRDCFSLNQCIYERILRCSPQQMETGYADLLSLPAGGFPSVWYARKSAEKQYLCRKLYLMFMENCVFRASFSKLSWLCF